MICFFFFTYSSNHFLLVFSFRQAGKSHSWGDWVSVVVALDFSSHPDSFFLLKTKIDKNKTNTNEDSPSFSFPSLPTGLHSFQDRQAHPCQQHL